MGPTARTLIQFLEKTERRPIVVASHPRSGTHLVIDSLRLNFPDCSVEKRLGEPLHHLYFDLDSIDRLSSEVAIDIARRCKRPLFKTHAGGNFRFHPFAESNTPYDLDLVAWLRRHATFVYAYRDGREALCSMQDLMRPWEPAARGPHSQFLRQPVNGMSRAAYWGRHVQSWLDESSAFCTEMEGLLRFPQRVLPALGERLGMSNGGATWALPEQPGSIFHQRLTRVFSRRPASTAIILSGPAHRKWREVYSEADRAFFADQTGDLLIRLGYEESPDWIRPELDAHPSYPAGHWNDSPRDGGDVYPA